MTHRIASLSVLLLLALLPVSSYACSDSLYRVGKGVSYRVYTAPLPGNVLIYGSGNSAADLASALSSAGHMVKVIDNELALGVELNVNSYDVILAAYGDHQIVESGRGTEATVYIPVAMNSVEARLARQTYDNVLTADRDELKHYLKAIHQAIRRRDG